MAPPRAPVDVSISSRAGQSRSISETQPSAASTRSDLATDLISRTASFSRVLAREDPRQPYACARNLALKAHRWPLVIGRVPRQKAAHAAQATLSASTTTAWSAYLNRDR